jgi:hypothetical protein
MQRTAVLAIAAVGIGLLTPARAADGEPADGRRRAWAVSASVAAYVLRDEADYLQPTATGDRGWLHLEARYNYEDRRTGSLFVGWNFELREDPSLTLTPLLGAVFGRTAGVAPGLAIELGWGLFDLHSESEYVIDARDLAASFFYSWSEAGVRLGKHLRAGLVVQRTKVFHTPRVIAVGPLVGASVWKIDASVSLFDPFDSERFLVASLALSF